MARIGIAGAVVAVVLLLAAALSPAAWGTFPGRDGRIAFDATFNDGATIATMEPDGSDVRHLRRGSGPAWSADGKRIVFTRRTQSGSDIYLIRGDGTGLRRLTSSRHWWDASPAFSPNGRRIVFERIFQGQQPRPHELAVIRLTDLRTRVLTTDATAPEWSPNGRRIVFSDDDPDTAAQITSIRPDGTHKRLLTSARSSGLDFDPAYSSDGSTIFFERDPWSHTGRIALMKIGAFGGTAQRVPVPAEAGYLQSSVPDPEGRCVVGVSGFTGQLYALGETCPTQGWLNHLGDEPSWQPLPSL